jgi:hypothetical protein
LGWKLAEEVFLSFGVVEEYGKVFFPGIQTCIIHALRGGVESSMMGEGS